jgi:mRNA-degrading endonuclease RelE of RelBE toxin-antitoxin system
MASFYIERIVAAGPNRTPSIITFKPGLNIICGASDTGKTAILKSIKFIFGGDKPFPAETGFDTVTMRVATLNGFITFTRKLGKATVNVLSEIDFINSGEYDIEYDNKKGNNRPVVNSVWLKLIGINHVPRIIKNKDFVRKHLKWTTFLRSFYLNEDDIGTSESIMLPSQNTVVPLFLSALVFLFTGQDFADMEVQETEAISAARKNAIETFVSKQVSIVSKKRYALQEELKVFEGASVEAEIQHLVNKLSASESAITAAAEESKDLLGTLLEYKEKEAGCQMIYSRYQSLKSQYISDIERLTFITEGEALMKGVPSKDKCPFCDGAITAQSRKSYIEASRFELARIISQLQGLTESEADIVSELKETRGKLEKLENRRNEIEELIEEQLTPHVNKLKAAVEKYRIFIQLQNEIEVLHTVSEDLQHTLIEEPEAAKEKLAFRPKDHLPKDFKEKMDEYAYSILEECQYQGLNTAHFNLGKFDLEVNGEHKSESHGKGYRAFINTVLGLAFRHYYINDAVYNPGLFMVDTPLLGLDQGLDDQSPESMKKGLFKYFIKHQSEGQTIIVENTKDMPDMDYEAAGAKVIEFTHDNYESKYSESRYGFLVGVVGKEKS